MSVVDNGAIPPQASTRGVVRNADNGQTGMSGEFARVITAEIRCVKCRAKSNYTMSRDFAGMVAGFVDYRCGGCGSFTGGRVVVWRETNAGDPPLHRSPVLALRPRP